MRSRKISYNYYRLVPASIIFQYNELTRSSKEIDMRDMRIPVIILFILLIPVMGYSQKTVITIQDALDMAMDKNPELNRIQEQVQVQKTQLGTAWGVESPDIYYLKEGMNNGLYTEKRWGVSQTFAFPLTGYYQNRRVRSEVQSTEIQVEAIRQEISRSVKKAYIELVYAIKYLELTEKEVELARNLREIAQKRLDVGDSNELDVIRSEIEYSQAGNSYREGKRLVYDAQSSLFRIIGQNSDQHQNDISYPDTLRFHEIHIQQDQVFSMIGQSPKIQTAIQDVESARMDIRVARSGYLPDLKIDYYRQDYGDGFAFDGFQVGVSVPLWFILNEKSNVQRANAVYKQSEWMVRETELQIREEAEAAWHRYEATRENILEYRDSIHSRSFNLLELAKEGYMMGELDFLHVLEAQRTYINTQIIFYQSLRDYYIQLVELEQFLPNELVFTDRGES